MSRTYPIYILFLFILAIYSCDKYELSENQATSFVKYIGKTKGTYIGKDILQTKDIGGENIYAVLGNYKTSSGKTIYFTLIDKHGNIIKTPEVYDERLNIEANKMVQDAEGNFYITGTQINGNPPNIDRDIYLLKLDRNGSYIYSRSFNSDTTLVGGNYNQNLEFNKNHELSSDDLEQEGYDIIMDSDTSLIIAGYTEWFDDFYDPPKDVGKQEFLINVSKDHESDSLKLNAVYIYGFTGIDEIRNVLPTNSDTYYYIGTTDGETVTFGRQSLMLVRRNILLYNYSTNDAHYISGEGKVVGNLVINTTDENHCAFVGTDVIDENYSKAIYGVIEYVEDETNEKFLEPKTFTFGTSGRNTGKYIVKGDDGIFFFGEIDIDGYQSIYLKKTDFDGNEKYTKTYGGPEFNQQVSAVIETSDNGFIIIGTNSSDQQTDITLIKINESGNLQ